MVQPWASDIYILVTRAWRIRLLAAGTVEWLLVLLRMKWFGQRNANRLPNVAHWLFHTLFYSLKLEYKLLLRVTCLYRDVILATVLWVQNPVTATGRECKSDLVHTPCSLILLVPQFIIVLSVQSAIYNKCKDVKDTDFKSVVTKPF